MIQPRINLSAPPALSENNPWVSGFLQPVCTLRCDARTLRSTAAVGASVIRQWDDPLQALDWMSKTFWPGKGRWIGWLGYDLGRLFETIPKRIEDELDLPLFIFTYCRSVGERSYAPEPEYGTSQSPFAANFSREGYEAAVRRVIEYIGQGDVFQVNLSQRFSIGLGEHPAKIYHRLCRESPAMYGAYFGYGDLAILCNSPELFLQVTPDRRVITRPIKGTRPLGDGMERELRDSAKDAAELNMIVDLERNDLGRVCQIGSVKVSQPRTIEQHPTLHHGVATVEGILRDEIGFVDLLRATFPGGSVTGAPKIRAMQIIEELETVRRGPYCGAIGWLDSTGSMQFNVAIRTLIVKDSIAHIHVGGGIVAESDPADEYDETLVKAKAIFAAMGVESLV